MPKRGKNYEESIKSYNKQEVYDVPEAMDIITKTAKAKFDETIEAHIRLGVDGRHAVRQRRFWYSPKDRKQQKQKLQVQIL